MCIVGGFDKMDESERARLLNLTRKLMKEPINEVFLHPVTDVADYKDVVEKPMWFLRICEKLENGEYKHSSEWYNDVILIYDNCIKFNGRDSYYGAIAEYNMERFEKMAVGYNCANTKEWYELVQKTFDDVLKLAGNSPVPQGLDPMLENIVKNAERQMTLKPGEIRQTIARVDHLANIMARSREIEYLLKKCEPDLKLKEQTSDTIVIDADKLSERAVKALYMYVKAHSGWN